jgi:hypothetical protein
VIIYLFIEAHWKKWGRKHGEIGGRWGRTENDGYGGVVLVVRAAQALALGAASARRTHARVVGARPDAGAQAPIVDAVVDPARGLARAREVLEQGVEVPAQWLERGQQHVPLPADTDKVQGNNQITVTNILSFCLSFF